MQASQDQAGGTPGIAVDLGNERAGLDTPGRSCGLGAPLQREVDCAEQEPVVKHHEVRLQIPARLDRAKAPVRVGEITQDAFAGKGFRRGTRLEIIFNEGEPRGHNDQVVDALARKQQPVRVRPFGALGAG
jgi:hypothetical protein